MDAVNVAQTEQPKNYEGYVAILNALAILSLLTAGVACILLIGTLSPQYEVAVTTVGALYLIAAGLTWALFMRVAAIALQLLTETRNAAVKS